jgi:RNA polymerase sigma factor (sigma-70 family)
MVKTQEAAESAAWNYVLKWVETNASKLTWAYKKFGWSTDMEFEDFKQQAILAAYEIYNKLAAEGAVTEKKFTDGLIWSIRSHCWKTRDKVRRKDIGLEGEEEVVTLSLDTVDNALFYGQDNSESYLKEDLNEQSQEKAGNEPTLLQYEMYAIVRGMLDSLTVTECEYLSDYLGLGDLSKLNMKEIGKRHGVTESAVSQLILKAKKKLIKLLKSGARKDNAKSNEYKAFAIKYLEPEFIKVQEPFCSVCPISENMVFSIARSIKEHGYDESQPLIVWKEENILLDGHTRLKALKLVDYDDKVPVMPVSFPDTAAALRYMLSLQFNRRNINDVEVITTSERILNLFNLTNEDEEVKTKLLSEVYEELPISKVKKVVKVLEYADEEERAAVNNEKATINELYMSIRRRFFVVHKQSQSLP